MPPDGDHAFYWFAAQRTADATRLVAYGSPDAGSTSKGYAIAGDDFLHDQYERPLDKNLAYRPDLDILSASLTLDSQWLYISIQLAGTDTGKQTLDAYYGAEFDVNWTDAEISSSGRHRRSPIPGSAIT